MSNFPLDMRAIKADARSQFGQVPGVEGFGVGDGVLRVYVRHAGVCKQLPTEFQGIPLEVVVTGDIAPQPGTLANATQDVFTETKQ